MCPDCTTLRATWMAEGSLHWWKPVIGSVDGRLCLPPTKRTNELVAFRKSCHLVEEVSWYGERCVGRRKHHWSSLTETWQLGITSMTFCVRLSYYFSISSHVASFINMTTPDPIQPESCKTSLTCCNGPICCQQNTYGMSWIVVFNNTHILQPTNSGHPKIMEGRKCFI